MSEQTMEQRLSAALTEAGIEHTLKVMPCDDGVLYSVEALPRFTSVLVFASACERAGVDAVYSAALGWTFVSLGATETIRKNVTAGQAKEAAS